MTVPISRLMRNEAAFRKEKVQAGIFDIYQSVPPISGTAGHGVGLCGKGSRYIDVNTGVVYRNHGDSLASPFWSPLGLDQENLLSFWTDFRDGKGKAHADTDPTLVLAGSGIRIHGQGIAETDSGVVVTFPEGGPLATLTTTDEDAHLVAISAGALEPGTTGANLPFQPDTQGPLVVEATVSMITDLLLRRFFIGFVGVCPDALNPPVTGATTTITLVQNDVAGIFMDAALTAATTLFAVHNKADEAATQTAAATTTGTVFPAVGTSVRFRVEIDTAGTMYCFRDRVLIATVANALTPTEEVAPVCLIGSTSAAVKAMAMRRFATWGAR